MDSQGTIVRRLVISIVAMAAVMTIVGAAGLYATAGEQTALLKIVCWTALVGGPCLGILFAYGVGVHIRRSLGSLIDDLGLDTARVAVAADHVSAASQMLAEGSSEQAAAVEETSSSLEEIASSTRSNAESAQQAQKLMEGAAGFVDRGQDSMDRLSKAISGIKQSADQTARIVKTIDEIAFQTNLLALNAAVEAARAGDAGKGFAVVAEEVRNLAQRAGDAARNTAAMLEESVHNAEHGVGVAGETSEALRAIAESSAQVQALIAEIASSSGGQAQGVDQINTGVAQMDAVSQQNAASAEECASAAHEMNAQAAHLKSVAGRLALIFGQGAAEHGKRARLPAGAAESWSSTARAKAQPELQVIPGGLGARASNPSPQEAPEAVIPFDDEDEVKLVRF